MTQEEKKKTENPTIEKLLKEMESQQDFPAISRYISEINEKAAPGSTSSASQLASVIFKDYALTTKLLKMVNSAIYSQFSGQIATISRAVVILGFEQVRMAATGLVFFEHLKNRAQANVVKKSILASFLSGILARDMGLRMKQNDVEDLFICALLHHFGKLLLMYYFPEDFARVTRLINDEHFVEADAIVQVFNCSSDMVGMAVAESWGLPQKIITSMKGLSSQETRSNHGSIDSFRCLACFSNEIYALAASDQPYSGKRNGLLAILRKYEKLVPVSEKTLLEMMDRIGETAKGYSSVLNLGPQQDELVRQLTFKPTTPKTPEPAPEPAITDLSRFATTRVEAGPAQPTANQDSQHHMVIMNGIQEVTMAMLDTAYSLDDIINMVMETAYRGLGFSRVLIGIKDPKTGTIAGRFGLGSFIDETLRKFRFTVEPEATDLFNMAITQGEDLYVDRAGNPDVATALPAWYRGILVAPSFAIYPVIVKKNGIGILYADMKESEEPVTPDKLNYLKMLRNQIVLAIVQKSSG